MKMSISLEMWIQCGPSHVQCGCNVDPPHLHILNVDVMWSNVDVLWISTFQMWINAYILQIRIMEICVHSLINTDYMWTTTLKMWIHHISTSWQCGSTTSPHLNNVEFPHLHIWQFDLYPLSNQSLVGLSIELWITFWAILAGVWMW